MSRLLEPNPAQDRRALTSPSNGRLAKGPLDTTNTHMNALKLGLTAQKIILPGESEEEFQELATAIQGDLLPVGRVQAEIVDRITLAFWKLKRVTRAEHQVMMTFSEITEINYTGVYKSGVTEKIGVHEYRLENELRKNIAFLKVLQAQGKKDD